MCGTIGNETPQADDDKALNSFRVETTRGSGGPALLLLSMGRLAADHENWDASVGAGIKAERCDAVSGADVTRGSVGRGEIPGDAVRGENRGTGGPGGSGEMPGDAGRGENSDPDMGPNLDGVGVNGDAATELMRSDTGVGNVNEDD